MAKETQKDKVIKWLKSGRTLTPKEALLNGMGMRLGAIICDLRKAGLNIINLHKTGSDRYANYKLVGGKNLKDKLFMLMDEYKDGGELEDKDGEPQYSLDLGKTKKYEYPD